MAKYSKEQRRCAVELYVRYECCAADLVRELGYPSREASRMWHRDWLEEQRTGVPSTRGERYARYTTEQKRAAVDHYLTHGRRASRTMRRLGYPSKEVLAAWIDELAPGERHVRRGPGPRRAQTCFASMFVRQVRQCFSVVWADGFPRCRHRFPVM